jgi:mitochondrial fission protein ELM1
MREAIENKWLNRIFANRIMKRQDYSYEQIRELGDTTRVIRNSTNSGFPD